jgi:septal ring factor EnvC (AmiA/AmiB activator)
MTKEQEIKIIEDAIAKLGNNSYLGESLKEMLPYIKQQIQSDFIPDIVGRLKEKQVELSELETKISDKKLILEHIKQDINVKSEKLNEIKRQVSYIKDTLQDI